MALRRYQLIVNIYLYSVLFLAFAREPLTSNHCSSFVSIGNTIINIIDRSYCRFYIVLTDLQLRIFYCVFQRNIFYFFSLIYFVNNIFVMNKK